MSWYFLGGVLGVGDGAVGQHREPLRVVARPRMIRRALQRQVEGHLEALVAGGGDEVVEIVDGPEGGMHSVVTPPSWLPIAHGEPTSSGGPR